jgi:hypothetical protein
VVPQGDGTVVVVDVEVVDVGVDVVVVPPVRTPCTVPETGAQKSGGPACAIVENVPENASPSGVTVPSMVERSTPWPGRS